MTESSSRESAFRQQNHDGWMTLVRDDPAKVLGVIAGGGYVPFSARRALEDRGLFDLNTETYGITPAGREALGLGDTDAPR
jgi:hypothetical protein